MAAPITEAELIGQWKAAVDIMETFRVHADDTLVKADGTGKLAILEDAVSGEFTPAALTAAADSFRGGLSALLDPSVVREFIDPILFEYGRIIDQDVGGDTFGGGYATPDLILESLYEFFVKNAQTITSRAISFQAVAITTAVGNGVISRLTVDENNFELEACTVEKKHFRCRADQNSGTEKYAEVFEHLGQQASKDNLLQGFTGSGLSSTAFLTSRHAGGSDGGSLLNNGSFSDFATAGSPKFASWDQVFTGGATASGIAQHLTVADLYRSFPGETTAGALDLTVNDAGHTISLRQTLKNLNAGSLRRDRPYFLRVMLRKDIGGTATGGTVKLTLGSRSVTIAVSAMTAGWQELVLPLDQNSWFVNFNQDEDDGGIVEIEWSAGLTNSILFDDMIFSELNLIDGTYWNMRLNAAVPVAWLVDDELTVTDAYDTVFGLGKLQYYMKLGYGRYLPHQSVGSITDP